RRIDPCLISRSRRLWLPANQLKDLRMRFSTATPPLKPQDPLLSCRKETWSVRESQRSPAPAVQALRPPIAREPSGPKDVNSSGNAVLLPRASPARLQ